MENNVQALYTLKGNYNVVHFDSWYTTNSHAWQVVELCDGGSLAAALRADGAFPENHMQMLAAGILAGICAAHEHSLVIAALHPSGVMLSGDGRPKLADFKLSSTSHVTSAPSPDVLAAIPYLAPEYSALSAPHSRAGPAGARLPAVGPASSPPLPPLASPQDIWSFGCLLYEGLYEFPPFVRRSSAPPQACTAPPQLLQEPPSQARHQVPHGRPLQLPFLPTAQQLSASRSNLSDSTGSGPMTPQRARAGDSAVGAPPRTHPTLAMQHLLSTCLNPDPAQRATLEHLCSHPFFMVSAQLQEGGGGTIDAVTVAPLAPVTPPDPARDALLELCGAVGYSKPRNQPPDTSSQQGGDAVSADAGGSLDLAEPPPVSRLTRPGKTEHTAAAANLSTAASAISHTTEHHLDGGSFLQASFELSLDTSAMSRGAQTGGGRAAPLSAFPAESAFASGQFAAMPPSPPAGAGGSHRGLQPASPPPSKAKAADSSTRSSTSAVEADEAADGGASPDEVEEHIVTRESPPASAASVSPARHVPERLQLATNGSSGVPHGAPQEATVVSSSVHSGTGGGIPPPPAGSPPPPTVHFTRVPVQISDNTLGALDSTHPPDDVGISPVVGSSLVTRLVTRAAEHCQELEVFTLHFRVFHTMQATIEVGGVPILRRSATGGGCEWAPHAPPLPPLDQLNACKQRQSAAVEEAFRTLSAACKQVLQGSVVQRSDAQFAASVQVVAAVALGAWRAPALAQRLMGASGDRGTPLYLITSAVAQLSEGLQGGLSVQDSTLLTSCLGALAIVCRFSEHISSGLFHDGTDDTLWHALVLAMQQGMRPPLTHLGGLSVAACLLLCEAAFVAGGSPGGAQLRAPPSVAWALHAGAALGMAEMPARAPAATPCAELIATACVQTLCNLASVAPPDTPSSTEGALMPQISTSPAIQREEMDTSAGSTSVIATLASTTAVLSAYPWVTQAAPIKNKEQGGQQTIQVDADEHNNSATFVNSATVFLLAALLGSSSCSVSADVTAGALAHALRALPQVACAVNDAGELQWAHWLDWRVAAEHGAAFLSAVSRAAAAKNANVAFPQSVQYRPPTAHGSALHQQRTSPAGSDSGMLVRIFQRLCVVASFALCAQDAAAAATAAANQGSNSSSSAHGAGVLGTVLPPHLHAFVEIACDTGCLCVLEAMQGGTAASSSASSPILPAGAGAGAAARAVVLHCDLPAASTASRRDGSATVHIPIALCGVLSRMVAYGSPCGGAAPDSAKHWGAGGVLAGLLRGGQTILVHALDDFEEHRPSSESFVLNASGTIGGGGGGGSSPSAAAAMVEYLGDEEWLDTCCAAFAKGVKGGCAAQPHPDMWTAAAGRVRALLASVGALREWEPFNPPAPPSESGDTPVAQGEWRFDDSTGSNEAVRCVSSAVQAVLAAGTRMFQHGTLESDTCSTWLTAISACMAVSQGMMALEGAPHLAVGGSPALQACTSCLAAAAACCSKLVQSQVLEDTAAGTRTPDEQSSAIDALQDVTGVVVETASWCEGGLGGLAAECVTPLHKAIVQNILPAAIAVGSSKSVPRSAHGVALYTLLQMVGWRADSVAPLIVAQGGLPVAVQGVRLAAETLFQVHSANEAADPPPNISGGGGSLVPLHDAVQLLHALMSQGQVNTLRAAQTHELAACFMAALRAVLQSRAGSPLLPEGGHVAAGPPLDQDDMEGGSEDALQSLQYLLLAITDCAFEVTLVEHLAAVPASKMGITARFDTSEHGSLHLPESMGTPPRPTQGGLRMSGGGLNTSVSSVASGGLTHEQRGALSLARLLRSIAPLLVHMGTWAEVYRRSAGMAAVPAGVAPNTLDTLGTLSVDGPSEVSATSAVTPLDGVDDVMDGLVSNVSNAATRLLILVGKAVNTRPFIAQALAAWSGSDNDVELVRLAEGVLGGGSKYGLPPIGELSSRAASPLDLVLHALMQGSHVGARGAPAASPPPHTQSRLLKLLHLLLRAGDASTTASSSSHADAQTVLRGAIQGHPKLLSWLRKSAATEAAEGGTGEARRGARSGMAGAVLRLLSAGGGARGGPPLGSTAPSA